MTGRRATAAQRRWLKEMSELLSTPEGRREWRLSQGLPPEEPTPVDDPRIGRTLGRPFTRVSKPYKRRRGQAEARKKR